MHHALILGHPNPKSFCAALAEVYATAARARGDTVVVRDLYALDFDPRLKASEIPASAGYAAAPDVVAERDALRDADVFCLVYPFWFNAAPAILKGYIDRVLSMGFGYRSLAGENTPCLGHAKLLSISTSGAPDHWVAQTDALKSLVRHFDMHLAAMTGMTFVDHLHFGAIVGELPAEEVAEIYAAVRQAVESL